MKVIYGGKQLSFIKDTEEVLKFLECVVAKNGVATDIVKARIEACQTCFSKVPEENDRVEWILEHAGALLQDESNEMQDHLKDALEDFQFWSKDPFGWERKHTSAYPFEEPTSSKVEKRKTERLLTFPVRKDLCVEVKLPEGGLSVDEFQRLGLFLYPYCNDLDLTQTFSWINTNNPEKV
jgi:hypothetical protein